MNSVSVREETNDVDQEGVNESWFIVALEQNGHPLYIDHILAFSEEDAALRIKKSEYEDKLRALSLGVYRMRSDLQIFPSPGGRPREDYQLYEILLKDLLGTPTPSR